MHRAGLTLVLQELPTNLGAYHVLGSNIIIINGRISDIIKTGRSLEEATILFWPIRCRIGMLQYQGYSCSIFDFQTVSQNGFTTIANMLLNWRESCDGNIF